MSVASENTGLYKELKEAINSFLQSKGKTKQGDGAMYFKMALYAILPPVGYSLMLTLGKDSLWIAFAGYLVFILGLTLFVVNVAHDASHHALLKTVRANKFMSYSWNLIGISRNLWEIKHHHSHHIYTNIPHQDVDIEESPLLRFSPVYPYRPHYRFQYLYAPLLYSFFGFFIIYVKDFIMYGSSKIRERGQKHFPAFFLPRLILIKSLFLLVTLLIPLWVLPFAWWQVLLMYLACLGIGGALMLLVLVAPHINTEADLSELHPNIHSQDEWILHQISNTVDSSPGSRVINYLSGGLNTHLIHHIFPQICHIHYYSLTNIVRGVLREHGITYHEKSFTALLSDHFRHLKQMGKKPSVVVVRPHKEPHGIGIAKNETKIA